MSKEGRVLCPILTLVVRGPTCWCVISFVGLSFVAPLLLPLLLRTSAALQTIGDPNLDVSLARRGLRNLRVEMGVMLSL